MTHDWYRRWPMLGLLAIGVTSLPAYANAPPGRYTATGGVVHDNVTGLDWQQVVPSSGGDDTQGRYTWAHAQTNCSGMGAGWRLPTVKELFTIVDFSSTNPSIDTSSNGFPGTPPDYFWTVTTVASTPTSRWTVGFGAGNTGQAGVGTPTRGRCVR